MNIQGEPIRGHIHSTDASSGVAVALFNPGEVGARTLQADEYIEVHQMELISAAGGDCAAIFGANSTIDTGEIIVRGTFGVNGGLEKGSLDPPRVGGLGETIKLIAPIGVIDFSFQGTIRREQGTKSYPDWKADRNG